MSKPLEEYTGHQPEEQLELYVLGRLPESEAALVEEHLLACDSCRESAEELQEYAVAMRSALEEPVPVRETSPWLAWLRQPRFVLGTAFAALLVAIGISWFGGTARVPAMATLELAAMRGEMPSVAQAKSTTLKLLDAPSGSETLRLELVDGTGAGIWTGNSPAVTPLEATIPQRLSPGDYFVRLYNPTGKLLHEYGFRVE